MAKQPDKKPGNKAKLSDKQLALLKDRLRKKGVPQKLQAKQTQQRFLRELFDKQRDVIIESEHHDRVALLVGRGGGKSFVLAAKLLLAAESNTNPMAKCCYVTLTKAAANNIIMDVFEHFDKALNLNLHFDYSRFQIVHPNGTKILLAGADDNQSIHQLRGQTWCMAALDECGQLPDDKLRKLLEDVIKPRLQGPLWLAGTPGEHPQGIYYDVTEGDPKSQYKVYRWTVTANPRYSIETYGCDYLEKVKKENGYRDDSPTFLREYLGQWVYPQDDDYVFSIRPDKDAIDCMPEYWSPHSKHWIKILGIDYGYHDPSAMCLLAFLKHPERFNDWRIYVVRSECWKEKTPSELAAITKEWCKLYHPSKRVGDMSGVGKAYSSEANHLFDELRLSYAVHIEAAQKRDKHASVDMINNDFKNKAIRIVSHTNAKLIKEMSALQWDERRVDVKKYQDDDVADAFRYAHRELRVMGYRPPLDGFPEDEQPTPKLDPYYHPEVMEEDEDDPLETLNTIFDNPKPWDYYHDYD